MMKGMTILMNKYDRYYSVPVSAEGRVEHQKLNQVAALLSPGSVFGVQLDYSCRLKSVPSDAEKVVGPKIWKQVA